MIRPVFLALLALVLTASAPGPSAMTRPTGPASGARQCFTSSSINNYVQQDDRTVNVRARVRDVYQLTLMSSCPDIKFAQGVIFDSRSQAICSGIDVTLLVPEGLGPRRCEVSSVRRLTPEEVAALPPRARP